MLRSQNTRDRYLLAAFRCTREGRAVTVGGLAAALGVTAPSASVMVKGLIAAGLLRRRDQRLALTAEGESRGARLLRRHRLAECLLADVLGVPLARVHEEAKRLAEALSESVLAALAAKLDDPGVCPHGHAIPGESERAGRSAALVTPIAGGEALAQIRREAS